MTFSILLFQRVSERPFVFFCDELVGDFQFLVINVKLCDAEQLTVVESREGIGS